MRGALALVGVLLGSTGSARADDAATAPAPAAPIVGILRLDVVGASAAAERKFEQSIEEGLAEHGLKVAPRQRLADMMATSGFIEGCSFGPCLRAVRTNTQVSLVLIARITSVGPSYDFVISLVETEHGRVTSQVAERCEVCTMDEAVATATLSVIQVITGAGGATTDPDLDPTGKPVGPDSRVLLAQREAQVRAGRTKLRRAAVFFLGAAVVAAGAGAYFLSEDRRDLGYGGFGGAGAFALASGTLLVISRL
jgi:hypothetical protein